MLVEPVCWTRRCKHFRGVYSNITEMAETLICAAFPDGDGIPLDIAYGSNPHDKPQPNQANEIVYEAGEMEALRD